MVLVAGLHVFDLKTKEVECWSKEQSQWKTVVWMSGMEGEIIFYGCCHKSPLK
jgi:hypothetical protein